MKIHGGMMAFGCTPGNIIIMKNYIIRIALIGIITLTGMLLLRLMSKEVGTVSDTCPVNLISLDSGVVVLPDSSHELLSWRYRVDSFVVVGNRLYFHQLPNEHSTVFCEGEMFDSNINDTINLFGEIRLDVEMKLVRIKFKSFICTNSRTGSLF